VRDARDGAGSSIWRLALFGVLSAQVGDAAGRKKEKTDREKAHTIVKAQAVNCFFASPEYK